MGLQRRRPRCDHTRGLGDNDGRVAVRLAAAGRRTLYVSGEESAEQVRLRAERLSPSALEVPVLAETDRWGRAGEVAKWRTRYLDSI